MPKRCDLPLRGVLPDIHADPGNQLPRMRETLHITDLGDHGQGGQMLVALVTGQRLDRLPIPGCCRQRLHLLAIRRQDLVQALELAHQQGKIDLAGYPSTPQWFFLASRGDGSASGSCAETRHL